MLKLKIIKRKNLEKLLLGYGFSKVDRKGVHSYYKHPDGRSTTLIRYRGRKMAPSLLREILREIKMNPKDYHAMVEQEEIK
ncbi:MAG: addiction module toxin, HicA family [bacterium]|nr:addiction module toxin, HicA family [bacterium]